MAVRRSMLCVPLAWCRLAVLAAVALLCAMPAASVAQGEAPKQPEKPTEGKADDKPEAGPLIKERVVESIRSITVGEGDAARSIRYLVRAGYLELPDYGGKHKANVFYVAYTLQPGEGATADSAWRSQRPITFAFNGGPGSSSVWLHLGALGPRRVLMGEEGEMPKPPYQLADNAHTWLDVTDLVFIDPVSTGYSRPAEGEDAKQFHGLNEDARSVADFIRLYVTRHHRWPSPKFLCGESYGTTRCAALAGLLQEQHGMDLLGIVLVSPILNFQTARFDVGNDMPYWLYLPTYTATAWYHKRIDADRARGLAAVLDESEAFARGEYQLALSRGDALSPEERQTISQRLSQLTGLTPAEILQANLRPRINWFTKALLRDQRRSVGRLDSRYTGIDRDASGASPDHDPSLVAITGPYTACLNEYLRVELGYENDLVYEILTGRVQPWSYADSQNTYVNVGETLRRAMSRNPHLRVLSCQGYYDLATPYFAMDHTIDALGLEPELRGNVDRAYYESGHMMYVRVADLRKLKSDVSMFYAKTLAR